MIQAAKKVSTIRSCFFCRFADEASSEEESVATGSYPFQFRSATVFLIMAFLRGCKSLKSIWGRERELTVSAALRRPNFLPFKSPYISRVKKGWREGHASHRWQEHQFF